MSSSSGPSGSNRRPLPLPCHRPIATIITQPVRIAFPVAANKIVAIFLLPLFFRSKKNLFPRTVNQFWPDRKKKIQNKKEEAKEHQSSSSYPNCYWNSCNKDVEKRGALTVCPYLYCGILYCCRFFFLFRPASPVRQTEKERAVGAIVFFFGCY